ncbi:MAG: CHAT domain-containing protein [Aquaticitalea sp.]
MKRNLCLSIFIFSSLFGYSQSIYHKDASTILADSLHNEGFYKKAIAIRKQAIKSQNKASKEYQSYLQSKYYHTKSADYEYKSYNYHDPDKVISKKSREQFLDSALQSAVKARDLYLNTRNPDRIFQYQIQNRIYHQTAYLGNWKHAFEQAQLGYKILKDTLSESDKTFVDLIYDIGFIYSKIGDYSKAVDNYQMSLDLYKNILGENHTDVAQAYNNIAVEYRSLGLRKKELESLLKAKSIWEQLNQENDKQFLYRCYGNLFYWYSYYGDFENAEAYILKKKNLRESKLAIQGNGFLRNKEEIYEDKLSEWYDLMLHYSRKKDTVNTFFYADTILKTINPDRPLLNFEVNKLCSTLKFRASLLKEKNKKTALKLLDKAIEIQQNHKEKYYTEAFPFQLDKIELMLEFQKPIEADKLLVALRTSSAQQEISNRFQFNILQAKTAQSLKKTKEAKDYFDTAFSLLNNSDLELEKVTIDNLKPLISFETISGFLDMGDFYMECSTKEDSRPNLKMAANRYLLASKIYNQLYLGQRYNDRLFTIYNAINERLLTVALSTSNNENLLSEIINSIENNGSKLTWSKFIFNNQRQQLNIPEHLINEEESTKAQLNFYQNALMDYKGNSEDKITLWKDKIYGLKTDLFKIQDSIKLQNSAYYQLNIKDFDVSNLQKSLDKDEVILKYLMTDDKLYSIVISKDKISLLPSKDKAEMLRVLKGCIYSLKHRTSNYQTSFKELRTLLFDTDDVDYNKMTIIPDGALNYFPFEVLIMDKKMPLISYSPSLLLFQEQNVSTSSIDKLNVGAFSAANTNSKLPKASEEIKSILKIFKGMDYLNATKSNFMEHANDYNVLHLAMHSNIDQTHPEFSSLNFYGESDNKLFISELYNETLNAKMAVLSACDTGNGFYENGEGVISLSRAFNYAGIPSTVMSLWKVDDEATAKIMTYFYEHLNQGESKDEALKNAKLDYLKNTDDDLLKHPYYWSGFVLTGNTDALVESHNYWYFLLILPFLGLIFFRKRLSHLFEK